LCNNDDCGGYIGKFILDFKSLRLFADLANSLHFTKTAELNHVSPSTLSRAIQRIEQELGCELLHRDNRTVVLTEAGQKFRQFADKQIEQWQQIQRVLKQDQVQLTGKLHVFCSVTAAYSHLPDMLDKFRRSHPLVEIVLTTGDAADALTQVKNQTVDIAIAAKPEKLSSSMHFHHLADIPLQLIAPSLSCQVTQQLQQSSINWEQIPFILPEHGPIRLRFDRWFRRNHHGKPNIYATVSGHEALVSMVALGCGIGFAPEVVIENSPVKERVQVLSNQGDIAPFELGVCCLTANQSQPLIRAFFAAIIGG